jgi:hypothetical protein
MWDSHSVISTPARKNIVSLFLSDFTKLRQESFADVKLSERVRNEVIREECGVKEGVVTKIEKNMLR